jgi:hypothetical protein
MKYELPFLFSLIAIGIFVKKLEKKHWAAIGAYVFIYIMFCWKRG